MNNIFETLLTSQKASQYALDNVGKINGFQFAFVTDNLDPLRLRRIKVSTESKGGLTNTDWLMPCSLIPFTDPPLPPIDSSVIVGFVNGNPHDGFYVGNVINRTNEPDLTQQDPVNDATKITPGNNADVTRGKSDFRIDKDLMIEGGANITIKNDAGCSIKLTSEGAVVIGDAFGHKLVLGGLSGGLGFPTDVFMKVGNAVLNMQSETMEIINATDLTINGQSVAVVGALDSDGDTLINKGY